jgi:phosphoribosylformylglycinamidine cyclo-ligase
VKPVAFALFVSGNRPENDIGIVHQLAGETAFKAGVTQLRSMAYMNEEYNPGEIDIAATVVGVIDQKNLITGEHVQAGDRIIGIQVDGYMTNGCSLVRGFTDEVVQRGIVSSLDDRVAELGGRSLKYEMSRAHRPMTDILFGYHGQKGVLELYPVNGMAHITGGGQKDNIVRMVPEDCKAVVKKEVLAVPPLMQYMRKMRDNGVEISEGELYDTFNMGVGFTLTVPEAVADETCTFINWIFKDGIPDVERKAAIIGSIEKRNPGEPKFEYA